MPLLSSSKFPCEQMTQTINQKTFRVISLENIDCGSGWEVNDAHYTGLEVTPESLSVKGVMTALKEVEYLAKHLRFCDYEFDEDYSERTFTLRRRRDGWFLCQIELKDGE